MKNTAFECMKSTSMMIAVAAVVASFCASVLSAQPSKIQTSVPVRELSAPTVATPTFSNIFSVRQIAAGQVLVNDAVRRQLIVLDNKLTAARIVLDSVTQPGVEGYGPVAAPIIAYLADSTFFLDRASLGLLVIDPNGKVIRSAAAPMPRGAFNWLTASASSVDYAGSLLLRAVTPTPTRRIGDTTATLITEESRQPDSTYILRANFDTRKMDTVARLKQVGGTRSVRTRLPDQRAGMPRLVVSPFETLDDWTTLADGTIALVRGGDYHVDFLRPSGKWESSAKLPFDWKPITDADKQRIVDSTRAYIDAVVAKALATGGPAAALDAQRDALIGSLVTLPGAIPAVPRPAEPARPGVEYPLFAYEFVPFKEMPSYFPPLRMGYTKGDADGNLWILPTTSAQSKAGELVYDVVSSKGVLTERVRVPLGRAIAGFGAGGVVYLTNREVNGLWHLERSRVLR